MATIETIHAGERVERVLLNAPTTELRFVQEAGSTLRLFLFSLYAAVGKPSPDAPVCHTVTVEQQGEGCTTEIYCLAYLAGKEQVSTTSHVHHAVGGGASRQLVKYVLADEAKGEFYGELKIAEGAQKTDAHQTNRNLLLSSTATMRTRPQLEIYADDVKATHGASTGQLDESALFYMQQRGIDEQKARQLLVTAFMKDTIDPLSDDQQRTALLRLLDPDNA